MMKKELRSLLAFIFSTLMVVVCLTILPLSVAFICTPLLMSFVLLFIFEFKATSAILFFLSLLFAGLYTLVDSLDDDGRTLLFAWLITMFQIFVFLPSLALLAIFVILEGLNLRQIAKVIFVILAIFTIGAALSILL